MNTQCSLRSTPPLCRLSIWNAVNLNANLVVTTVAIPIIKSPDPLRLVRQASATLRCRNTIRLVRRVAQIEIGRPDIAVYQAHTSAEILLKYSSCHSNSQSEHLDSRLTGNFMLHRPAATVVPEHDFVVRVATALHFPERRGAHAALGLAHRAVEIVVVPDVDVHGVVEGPRAPHVRVHANARLCTGCHQDGGSEDGLHIDGFDS
jgi:hypothetical protein